MKIESFLTFRLKVENLSRSVNWQDLKDLFRWGGEVTYAEAHVVIKYFQTINFLAKASLKFLSFFCFCPKMKKRQR